MEKIDLYTDNYVVYFYSILPTPNVKVWMELGIYEKMCIVFIVNIVKYSL